MTRVVGAAAICAAAFGAAFLIARADRSPAPPATTSTSGPPPQFAGQPAPLKVAVTRKVVRRTHVPPKSPPVFTVTPVVVPTTTSPVPPLSNPPPPPVVTKPPPPVNSGQVTLTVGGSGSTTGKSP